MIRKFKKMKNILLLINIWLFSTCFATENDYCERDASGQCKKLSDTCGNEDEPCFYEDELSTLKKEQTSKEESGYPYFKTLSRLKGYKVGHTQEFDIDGYKMKLTTRSLKPLLFEIPNALTEDEMDHILEKASNEYNSGGLEASQARGGLTPEDTFKPSKGSGGEAFGPAREIEHWDANHDGKIDLNEVALFAKNYDFLYFKEYDVKKMIEVLGLKEFDDGICTKEEFATLNTRGIEDYLNIVMRQHPKFKQRFSDQTWLPMSKEYDTMLSSIRNRFGKLMRIPEKILLGSEHLQIVRYSEFGHYHAHHDSETEAATDKPCCHHTSTQIIKMYARCRLCRFMTIMVYLQEPEIGGETAFPAADNITYSDSNFRHRGKDGRDLYNLSEHCQDANLVIKPKRGTAVAWYNHHVDYKGWLGSLDEFSLHGGCEVRKGKKWIANIWLTAPYKDDVHKLSMYSVEYMRKSQQGDGQV